MNAALLIAPGLILLMGIAAIVWGVRERLWWSGFQERAVLVSSEVVDVRTRRRSGRAGVFFSHTPQVAFALPDGALVRAWARFPLPAPPALGSALDVYVDTARPRQVMVAGGPGRPTIALIVIGGVLVLGGLGSLATLAALLD